MTRVPKRKPTAKELERLRRMGDELQQRRLSAGLTQIQLGKLADVDRSVIHKAETGKGRISDVSYAKIHRALFLDEQQAAHDRGDDIAHRVTVSIPIDGVPVSVMGDPDDVSEAVRNLLAQTDAASFERVTTRVPAPRQRS